MNKMKIKTKDLETPCTTNGIKKSSKKVATFVSKIYQINK